MVNVLFDLDGTLVDSSETISASLKHALGQMGIDPGAGRELRSLIGAPLLDIFCDEYGLGPEEAERAIDLYRVHYDAQAQAGTIVYAEVENMLQRLRLAGYRLFVATVKPTPIAEKVLADLGLHGHFDGVAGASLDSGRRDKRSIIGHALSKYGLRAEESAMVGDRDQDVYGARAHGLRSVGVTYGFGSRKELQAAAPDFIVTDSGQITALFGF